MNETLQEYFDALERLKSNHPINVPKGAKNAHIWTQFPKTLEQCLHFYLNTNYSVYLNTFLDKPKKQFYLR